MTRKKRYEMCHPCNAIGRVQENMKSERRARGDYVQLSECGPIATFRGKNVISPLQLLVFGKSFLLFQYRYCLLDSVLWAPYKL